LPGWLRSTGPLSGPFPTNFDVHRLEGLTGTGFWSDAERKSMIQRMRVAEFPVYASAETLAKNPQLVRLPECLSK
jgi:hypothetical protein